MLWTTSSPVDGLSLYEATTSPKAPRLVGTLAISPIAVLGTIVNVVCPGSRTCYAIHRNAGTMLKLRVDYVMPSPLEGIFVKVSSQSFSHDVGNILEKIWMGVMEERERKRQTERQRAEIYLCVYVSFSFSRVDIFDLPSPPSSTRCYIAILSSPSLPPASPFLSTHSHTQAGYPIIAFQIVAILFIVYRASMLHHGDLASEMLPHVSWTLFPLFE